MKRLSYILLAAMLVAVLAVSCTAEVIDDSLVAMVRFTENVGSRALEVSRVDISVGELYWKYDAAKVSGPASGAVTGKYLGQGLSKEAGPFSLGDWNFTLYGYKDKECKTLMYKGTGTGTVEKGKTNAIRISVEPQMTQGGTGSLHISKSIQLTKDGVVVKGSDGSTTYIATNVVVTRLSNGSEANVNADDSYFWKADGITSDSYKVVVSFVDAATRITHAENTVYVNVFDGLTTVISGTLDEVTSSISFNADVKEGRISETKTVTPDTETGNVSASFGFSPVSNESSTGNDVLGTTIEGVFTGSGSIELNVYGSEGASRKFAVENENSVVSAGFDINLSGSLAVAENESVTITTYIQPGLTGDVNVVYNRDEDGNDPTEGQPTVVSYEVETGKLVFRTTHFSEYYVVSDSVAENTTTRKRYATLQEAIDAASQDSTITVLSNISLMKTIQIKDGQSIVIDLNGHTISAEELPFMIRHGNVEFSGKGTIQETKSDGYGAILIKGSETDAADYSVVTVGKDVTLKGWTGIFVDQLSAKQGKPQAYGVVVNMHGTIVVPSETEHAAGHGIYLNGSVKYTEGNVPLFNIEGASITANSTGIYAAGYGKWNIKDTTINGVDTAIEIRAGEMNIESGTFTASAVPTEVTPNENGTTSSGSAMAVAQHTTKLPIAVSISGGTFEGHSALYESNPQKNSDEDIAKVQLKVTGGIFNAVKGGSVAVFSKDCKGFITGGTFNYDPSLYVADGYISVRSEDENSYTVRKLAEGEKAVADYETLKEAVKENGTIIITNDIIVDDTIAVVGKSVVLNMNGKTLSNTKDLWSDATGNWSLISVRNNGDLTITGNGTLKAKDGDCFAVDAWDGSIAIENGTFIGNVHAVYIQKGKAEIKGGEYSIQKVFFQGENKDYEFVLNCYDANRTGGTASIIVYGGTFVNFNPANCQAEGDGTNFVKDGCTVTSKGKGEDTLYTVTVVK